MNGVALEPRIAQLRPLQVMEVKVGVDEGNFGPCGMPSREAVTIAALVETLPPIAKAIRATAVLMGGRSEELSSNSIAERAGRRNAQTFLRSPTFAGIATPQARGRPLHRHDIPGTLYESHSILNEDIMRVAKWGNSLAVRLPKRLVDALSLKAGDELAIVDGTRQHLALAKDQRRKQALDNMRARRWKLPADYRFDREEANSR